MRPALRLDRLALVGALALSAATADAGESPVTPAPVSLFSASDLPRLADRGFEPPDGGKLAVKVWAPARQVWAVKADGDTLTLTSRAEGDDPAPRWQDLGALSVPTSGRVKLLVTGPGGTRAFAAPPKAPDASPKKAKDAPRPAPVPVPAWVAVTSGSGSDVDLAPALDLVRGRLGSVDPPDDPRRTHVRTNWEGADFRAPESVQAWRDRARTVREQLSVTLGLTPAFPKTPLRPQVFGRVERDGYTIEKVALETFPGFTLGGNLYRPVGKAGRLPAVLCPHGHWPEGRTHPDVQARCVRWAKLGAVVFLYDMVGYNDSKAFGHAFLNDRLRRWGLSLATLQTWNSVRALDWLTTLADVDPARVGCTGESGGGTQTFLLAAIDDRVKVAAPVVMVSDTFQGGCVCENAAGLRLGTDNVEFAALAAPRPLKLVGASGDWTAKTMTNAYPTLRDVYALYGTTDRISANVFDFPHNYNQTTRNAVYAFMGRWLLGVDDPSSTAEGDQSVEPADDLRAFGEANPAPANRKTPGELEDDLARARAHALDALAPSTEPAAWEAARGLLLSTLRVRVGLTNPAPAELAATEVRRSTLGKVGAAHALVGRKATGEQVPVVLLAGASRNGRLTVVASGRGKAGLLGPDGGPSPLVRALLDRGQAVVGFDPLLVGESVDPSDPAARRPDTVHFETYNPSLAADRLQDLATVLAWARSLPDVREVSLVGLDRAGPAVLLGRPALTGLARTAVDLGGFDDADGSGPYPDDLDLPGLLQFGGLKAAAALAAPAPLRAFNLPPAFDRQWPVKSYALDDASQALRLDDAPPSPGSLATWIDTGE